MPFDTVFEADVAAYGLAGRPHVTPADLGGDGTIDYVLSATTNVLEKYGHDEMIAVNVDGEELWRADTGTDPELCHHPWFHANSRSGRRRHTGADPAA